jgi:excinuclease ABC subunit B
MQRAIDETDRRRAKQIAHNATHGIQPRGVSKRIKDIIDGVYDARGTQRELKAAQLEVGYAGMDEADLAREIRRVEKEMLERARNLEFEEAARLRDELRMLKDRLFGTVTPQAEQSPALPAASSRRQPRRSRPAAARR